MKTFAVALVLLVLPSCAFLRDTGEAICAAQEKVAEQITKAGGMVGLGGLGPLVADFLNVGLELGCAVLDQSLSAPADVGDLIGVETPTTEPGSDEGPEG